MNSLEQRLKVVELYIKYNFREAKVIRELGYPTFNTIPVWYAEYHANGSLHEVKKRYSKYTADQKLDAIKHYFEHGQCISRTVETLGYPSRPLLTQWIKSKSDCPSTHSLVKCSQTKYFGAEGCETKMSKSKNNGNNKLNNLSKQNKELLSEKEMLCNQVNILQQEVRRLQLEKDVLEKVADVIKKDQGINLESLTNREKAIVINALRDKYQLKSLLKVFHMAKSSYCYQAVTMTIPDKYANLRKDIKNVFVEASNRYGYRRIHSVIRSFGNIVSEKVIRRIMKQEQLIVRNIKRKKYSSYLGEISPAVENVIKRDFHSDKPNEKWLTDITEFHIPAGKIYLSPIIDCFDGLPVSWTIGHLQMLNW